MINGPARIRAHLSHLWKDLLSSLEIGGGIPVSSQDDFDPRHLVGGQVNEDRVVLDWKVDDQLVVEVGLPGPGGGAERAQAAMIRRRW